MKDGFNVGVCTHYTSDWSKLAAITVPILDEYCIKHRYHISVQEVVPYIPYNGRDKILQAKYLLEYNDIVMVMDADAMITNFTTKVEDFIKDDYDLFVTRDYNGINCGVFIIRNSKWGIDLLDYFLNSIDGDIHCEQDALNKYVNEYGMDRICIVEHPAFNSLLYENYPEIVGLKESKGQWRVGDFVLHLPGIGMQKRIDILNETKNKIVYE
jgi:hypothetical protein